MYEAYWGLREKPFENTPDPRFLFQSDETADVFIRLLYTLKSNRGAALLTGESGCGKTLVIRALLQQLNPERTEIALVNDPGRTAVEFLREVLYQLGEETDAESRPEIVHRICDISLVIGYGRKLDSVDADWMRRLIQAAEGSRV